MCTGIYIYTCVLCIYIYICIQLKWIFHGYCMSLSPRSTDLLMGKSAGKHVYKPMVELPYHAKLCGAN